MGFFDIFKKEKENWKAKGTQSQKQQTTRVPSRPASSSSHSFRTNSPSDNANQSFAAKKTPTVSPTSPVLLNQQIPKRAPENCASRRSKSTLDLDRQLASPHLVPSSPVINVYKKTYDCVAFVVHCHIHSKIAVAKSPTDARWLPYVAKADKSSWYGAAREGISLVLASGSSSRYDWLQRNAPFDQLLLLDICRAQMVNTHKFINRYTFYVRLKQFAMANCNQAETSNSAKGSSKKQTPAKFTCCQDTESLIWLTLDFICEGCIENCWGPELVDFGRQVINAVGVAQAKSQKLLPPLIFRQKFHELSVEQLYEILSSSSGLQGRTSYLESLKMIKTSHSDIERLYNDYLDHSYPSLSITFDSFRHYMIKNNFETNEGKLKRLFNAFNRNKNGFLSFNELLMGLISLERDTPHVEFRIKFVYDYYDSKGRGVLLENDFRKMIRDLNSDRDNKVLVSENQIARLARDAMTRFKTKTFQGKPAVSFTSFLNGIGTHKFRGTSVLCRAKRNVFSSISRRITARTIKMNATKGKLAQVITKKNYRGSCQPCKVRRYKVVKHLTIIQSDGYCSEKVKALEMPKDYRVCRNRSTDQSFNRMPSETSLLSISANFVSDPIILERSKSAPFLLMSKIRHFNATKIREPQGIERIQGLMSSPKERELLVNLVTALYDQLVPIIRNEPRCKPVPSPSFVIGDIHGNLEDLISLEKTIWKRFPEINGMHYLFLGDYVDRGRWSVECALYLLSMKLLKPNNVTMLRGNHEVRDIQIKYTYRRECIAKYGETHGQSLWDITNKIFDHLPLCAIVDDNIFCAHGGIPHAVRTVDEINKSIQSDVPNPEGDCLVAWEIMWSDPMMPEPFYQIVQMHDPNAVTCLRPGFIYNQKRGTAYYFNDVGANDFLADNQLSHIIRAHEVPKFGFMFHFDFKCTTVFSCSHYCGNDNDSAVVYVDGSWMRVIRIDTSNNVPATDF